MAALFSRRRSSKTTRRLDQGGSAAAASHRGTCLLQVTVSNDDGEAYRSATTRWGRLQMGFFYRTRAIDNMFFKRAFLIDCSKDVF
jgi:hypothetical protein